MPSDLISSIQRMVTPDLIGKIANGLGYDKGAINQAVAAGIPAILAGLTSVADKSDGAQKIANVLSQSSATMDEVKSSYSGSEQHSIADHGASILSTLLGNGPMKAIANAVSEYAGLGPSAGKSLLGLLAPLVLGVLGQKQRSLGLDAGGIAHLLAGQKDSIAAALPSGFSNLLKGTGILDSLGGLTDTASQAANRAGATVGSAYERMTPPPAVDKGSGMSGWALAAAALLGIAGFAWFMSGPQPVEVAETTKPVAPLEGRAVSSPDDASPRVTLQVTTTVNGLRSALQEVRDSGTAAAALPKLRDTMANLDRLQGLAAQLPPESRRRIAALVTAAMPSINQLCDKVLADPQTADVARPAIEPIRQKLATLAAS
jgi:hypothetical protein